MFCRPRACISTTVSCCTKLPTWPFRVIFDGNYGSYEWILHCLNIAPVDCTDCRGNPVIGLFRVKMV